MQAEPFRSQSAALDRENLRRAKICVCNQDRLHSMPTRMCPHIAGGQVKFSYKQLVTMRLLLHHACTTLAMSADELEWVNVGPLLIPERYDFFESLKLPAIAGDAPITKSTPHVCQSPRTMLLTSATGSYKREDKLAAPEPIISGMDKPDHVVRGVTRCGDCGTPLRLGSGGVASCKNPECVRNKPASSKSER